MAAVKAGADRQVMHEVIREHSLQAWAEVAAARPNPLIDALCADARITCHLDPQVIRSLLDARGYVGDAPQRAKAIAAKIREVVWL
jgi:adenylosuccinate lyase